MLRALQQSSAVTLTARCSASSCYSYQLGAKTAAAVGHRGAASAVGSTIPAPAAAAVAAAASRRTFVTVEAARFPRTTAAARETTLRSSLHRSCALPSMLAAANARSVHASYRLRQSTTPPPPPSSSTSASTPPSSPAAATPSATAQPSRSSGSSGSNSSSSGGSGSGGGGGGGDPNPRSRRSKVASKNTTLLQYLLGVGILVLGGSWAAVPLYRAFCAHTGYGGTTQRDKDGEKLSKLTPLAREVVISFTADVNPSLHWSFVPSQPAVRVRLGEPTLAFYKATNRLDKAVTGVATYNVTPLKVGAYFHKIQCFCFDEQRLRAKEEIDMPVFFYIDPALASDRTCQDVTHITLSYTFFPVGEDEDDERTEEEKDAQGGLKLHGPDGQRLPPGVIMPSNAGVPLPPPVAQSSPLRSDDKH